MRYSLGFSLRLSYARLKQSDGRRTKIFIVLFNMAAAAILDFETLMIII